ncbi:MAG: ribosome-binding factor A [Candidatus Moranbacteria bacterium GW2011_GWF2_36_839]|nr:MAG: ribosome-binding factor A [Candidatus Moranbacteria bacterium GW2011_GWF1_36_78]KKQ16706.1 MAG: ribosome-binding factor A [Candidatus Moranbacteria bacterium GW2011_GWF2_36_839]
MNARIERINELIKQHTNNIILKDLSLKDGVFITIAKVDTTPDLRYTRVFVSVFPEKEISYAMKTLEKEVFQIQGKLNKKLHMRPLPKIEFRLDMTESQADKIEKILREI